MTVAAFRRYNNRKLLPASPNLVKTGVLRLPGGINWLAGSVLGVIPGTLANADVRITFGGTPTNGSTFQLLFGSDISDPIAFNSTAGTMVTNLQAAMDSLFGAGNTIVSGTGPYDIIFQNEYSGRAIALPTVASALTGTSPTVAATLQAAGHPGSGLAALYNDALSDGSQVARQLLMTDVRTNALGQVIGDHPGSYNSCETYTGGDFYCNATADFIGLIGLDAAGVADLGRLINAATIATPGAILHLNG